MTFRLKMEAVGSSVTFPFGLSSLPSFLYFSISAVCCSLPLLFDFILLIMGFSYFKCYHSVTGVMIIIQSTQRQGNYLNYIKGFHSYECLTFTCFLY